MASQKLEPECLSCTRQVGADCLAVQNQENSSVSDVLRKHFWFTEVDFQGAMICQTCWNQVDSFHQFYVSVEELYHIRLASLIVKSEPDVIESDYLPETSDYKLVKVKENPECSALVKEEPAFEIVDENEPNYEEEHGPDIAHHIRRKYKEPIRNNSYIEHGNSRDDYIKEHIRYICPECGEECPSFLMFLRHSLDAHERKYPFLECCGKRFYQQDRLYHHVRFFNNPDIFRCEHCGKRITSKRGLQQHILVRHSGLKKRKLRVVQHKERQISHSPLEVIKTDCLVESQPESSECKLAIKSEQQDCSSVVTTNYSSDDNEDDYIRQHVKYICQQCGLESLCFSMHSKHSMDAHATRAFVECCGKTFHRRDRLLDHVRVFNNPDLFRCKQCGKLLRDKSGFLRHMKMLHPTEEEQKFKCDRCPRTFAVEAMYREHIDIHLVREGIKPMYTCSECPAVFRAERFLRNHISMVHTRPIPRCAICKKNFLSTSAHNRHMKTMHPELPEEPKRPMTVDKTKFKCDRCPRTFAYQSMLDRHMSRHLAHEDARQNTKQTYPCTECDHIFACASVLRDHIAAIHKGISAYKCPFCGRNFNFWGNMRRHVKTVHPNEWQPQRKKRKV